MQANIQNSQADHGPQQSPNLQGFFADPRAYLSRDGEYLTIVLPGNMRVRKHRNWWLAILKVPFMPKMNSATEASIDP